MDTLLTDYLNSNSLECVPSYQQSELNDRYLNVKNSSNIDWMDRNDEHLEKNNEKCINLDEDDNLDYHSDLSADNLILSCEDSEELIDDIQFKEIGERYKWVIHIYESLFRDVRLSYILNLFIIGSSNIMTQKYQTTKVKNIIKRRVLSILIILLWLKTQSLWYKIIQMVLILIPTIIL